MVVRLTVDQDVAGSIPVLGAKKENEKMNDVEQMKRDEILEKVREVRSGKVVHTLCRDRFYPKVLDNGEIDRLSRMAEKTISYRARRAIEMYLDCYKLDKNFAEHIFRIGANHMGLATDEYELCYALMAEFGMIEVECRNDQQWNSILDRFPNITINGYKIHESSRKSYHVSSDKLYVFIHLKWTEDTGLSIGREDVKSFDGVNVILKIGKQEM